ncbi:uncharacterized protein LOC143266155 [Megachile rotundata]|uniref:uncharacterized protein LOC143266155 n=1 Tax=Megachile rotundata TaxID=143995 RepID=UPI003FD634FE
MRKRTREVLLIERSESRNTRLMDMRERARNRRKELLLQAERFKSAINIFADVPCAVCCRTLYPQQRYALHTQPLSHLIPANLIEFEKITICSRCLHHLKKHKVPSQAFWNKMEVMHVPQVISDLSEIEKYMLCRIVPFLKIMKIQNRFSQNWCKGQVVLFARDVFEVAEQLPVRLNETGIMIVVESLENLERQRQFELDVGKLRRALEWLLQNNALCKDVRPCFSNIINTISEIAHVTEELPIVRKEIEVAQRSTESNSIAAVACVAFNLLDPSTWCTSDIDHVLLVGDKYYRDCIEARNNPDPGEVNIDYLAVTELLPHLLFNNIRVGIDIGYEMAVNAIAPERNRSPQVERIQHSPAATTHTESGEPQVVFATKSDPIRLANIHRKTAPPLNLERERRMEELCWFFLFPDGKNGFGEHRDISITPLDYFQAREHTPQRLVDNVHLTMRNIRGSVSYWKRCCSELIAMVRSLGPPTWFATFSCNDLNWPDMLKALHLSDGRPITDFENLTFADRLKLVHKYPVVIARQFTNRGSPHLHMLIWCENVPNFLTNEGRIVIEKVVSCSLEAENQDMSDIVQRVQIHKHSNTCYKDRNNRCSRFGFPRPISETTICLGPDDTLANNGRFCVLKRTVNEVMVNNYNPTLLKLWEANMDIQPCGNVTAVAYYIAKYARYETSFFNNIFDRYAKRPDSLENLSLAEFAVRYETVASGMWTEEDGDAELRNDDEETSRSRFIKLKDNTPMRIRNKAAVLRHRYYTLNSDREGYFYNLIVCHIPFRDESTLMCENESSEQCFLRWRHELKPMLGNATVEQFTHAEQIIEAVLAQAVALKVVREGETNNEQLREPVSIHADETVYCDQVDLYEDQQQETLAMSEDVFLNSIRSLNVQQKDLLKSVSSVIEKDIKKNDDEDMEQMLLFITGGAGSGKSFILKLLVEHIKRCYNPTVDMMIKPSFIEVASLTGVAARQIFGKTLHSLFSLLIKKGTAMTYRRLTGQRLEQERRKWRYVRWLIIDEISMVSYENLRIIHLRLQEFKMNDKLFGGVNVLLFGDIMQLPPVKGHWCFIQPHWCSAEINLWHQFSFCELTINMRQRDDVEFIDLLNNLRFGEVTTSQLQILCERRRVPFSGEFEDGEAVRIFPTIKLVDEYNTKMTDKLAKSHRMYIIDTVDESREAATYGKRPPENVIPTNVNNCGGLSHTITLAEGSRIMLRRNISISDGLMDGAMGIVKKFRWPALNENYQLEQRELPDSVLIKFDDESVGNRFKDIDGYIPISPVSTTFQATEGYGDVERRMLPLILSWAVTVHKLQGTTLNKAVIDLGKRNFTKGQIYVALSRVKSLDGLVLSDLAPNKVLVKPHEERALAEMERLRRLRLQTNTANQLPATDT